ncbi:MAG: TlpA disulfide reductase family protein [Bryobacteraceae bacterium]
MLPIRMIIAGLAAALTLAAQQVPRKALELSVSFVDGKSVAVSQYRGKPLVVAFILTGCPHCQHTVGLLSQLEPRYRPRGVEMLAVAVNRDASASIPDFVQTYHPAFPVGFLRDNGQAADFCQLAPTKIPHMPILVFIDRDGTIRQQHEGSEPFFEDGNQEQHLAAAIEELLKPTGTKAAR